MPDKPKQQKAKAKADAIRVQDGVLEIYDVANNKYISRNDTHPSYWEDLKFVHLLLAIKGDK